MSSQRLIAKALLPLWAQRGAVHASGTDGRHPGLPCLYSHQAKHQINFLTCSSDDEHGIHPGEGSA